MEGVPGQEKPIIEMTPNEVGEYVMQARELIKTIDGYEEMGAAERVAALTALMETLAGDNQNRFVVEAMAREARAIELYEEIETRQRELTKLGRQLDVHA